MDYTDKQKQSVVGAAADTMRDMVFAAEAGSLIGSLQDLAKSLAVTMPTAKDFAKSCKIFGGGHRHRATGRAGFGT